MRVPETYSNKPNTSQGGTRGLPNVAVVFVTYNPVVKLLTESLVSISSQLQHVIIVDNGSANTDEFNSIVLNKILNVNLEVVELNQNTGLGYALNIGIKKARDDGFEYVLLMDQDSVPQPNMVHELYRNLVELKSEGLRIAAAGPRFTDQNGKNPSNFYHYSICGIQPIKCNQNASNVIADTLISSGTLINLEAVIEVGLMDELLFIDHVDTEWCWRAKAAGWTVIGVDNAFMRHSLGEKRKHIWFLRWRYISYHSPTRYYYIFRNSILLIQRPYVPLVWKLHCLRQLIMLLGYFVLLAPNWWLNLRMMKRGLLDGWHGIVGKI